MKPQTVKQAADIQRSAMRNVEDWTDEQLAPVGLTLHRHLKAGAVHAHLLRRIA